MANINRALKHRSNIDKQEKPGQFKATPVLEQQEHSFPGHKKSYTGIRKVGYTKPHISILMRNRWTLNTHWLHFFVKQWVHFFFYIFTVFGYHVYIYFIFLPDPTPWFIHEQMEMNWEWKDCVPRIQLGRDSQRREGYSRAPPGNRDYLT